MTPAAAIALLLLAGGASAQVRYFGKEVGALSELHHGVRGRVFAVDSRTLFLQDFQYDGEGPAAYFYVGTTGSPSSSAGATRLRDERGGSGPLRRYRGEGVTLSLPDGKTLKDYRWFSVYCDEYAVNFGDVSISREMEYPRPAKVSALRGVHGVSSDPIVVVDAQTLLVPNFSYDGEAPDAKFWVGRGDKPSPQGIRIPDENGKEAPLRKYDKKTIVLTLPGELTVFDIGHFAVWCEAFTVNFGHVSLPRAALANVPPSLKMLGVSPQSRNSALTASTAAPAPTRSRTRRPLARLDATTYRPPARLRPGAAPLASLADTPTARLPLHRRADSYTPPSQQLVSIQSSKELTYKEDGTLEQQDHQQQQQESQQQRHDQGSQQQQGLHHEQQLQQQQQEYQQLLRQHHLLQQRQQQIEQQQKLLNDQIYYSQQQQSDPHIYQQQQANQQDYYNQPQNEQQMYQQQLYEQQRRLYEQQQNSQHHQQQSEEPFQYRLLPYSAEGRA